jgi:riboflavin biosynthesis pyrimidine reductase
VHFEVLHPPGQPATAEELCAALAPWERALPDRPCVLGNMVASVDGRATVDGGSTGLGGEGDHAMFHALRGVVDAVLAGTGTLQAERYGRLVRSPERRAARAALGLEPDPVMLIMTLSGNVVWEAPLFDTPEQRVGIAALPGAVEVPPGVRAQVQIVELEDLSPDVALSALGETFGLRSVLCEGGPTLNASLLRAGVLDELFITLDPTLVGGAIDAPSIVAPLPERVDLSLRWVLRAGDELLLRYRTTR